MRRLITNWLPLLAWSAMILLSANDTMSAKSTGGWLLALFGWLSDDQLAIVNFVLRKLTHVVSYGILGALAMRATRGAGAAWILAVAIACAVAVADESLQSATALRGGSVWDVLLDGAAAATAATVIGRSRSIITP